jgi:hypothetical protein
VKSWAAVWLSEAFKVVKIENWTCQIFLDTIYQNGEKYTKLLQNSQIPKTIPNGCEILQGTIKDTYIHTNIFHFEAVQVVPKLGFLVCKYTIWQPWSWDLSARFLCVISDWPMYVESTVHFHAILCPAKVFVLNCLLYVYLLFNWIRSALPTPPCY